MVKSGRTISAKAFYIQEHPPHPDSQRIELSDHFETVARVVGDIGLGRGLQVHAVEVGARFHQFAQMIENRNSLIALSSLLVQAKTLSDKMEHEDVLRARRLARAIIKGDA